MGQSEHELYEQELSRRAKALGRSKRVRCNSCGRNVRTRRHITGPNPTLEPVWHRDPLKRRKWCAGSPGQGAPRRVLPTPPPKPEEDFERLGRMFDILEEEGEIKKRS